MPQLQAAAKFQMDSDRQFVLEHQRMHTDAGVSPLGQGN